MKILVMFVLTATLALVTLTTGVLVLAETSKEKQCQAESNLAFTWAFERDSGATMEYILAKIARVEGLTENQLAVAAANLRIIYDNPGIPPWIMGQIAYESCMDL